jgi:hypothetical protein
MTVPRSKNALSATPFHFRDPLRRSGAPQRQQAIAFIN